jgi:hypothetical protein
MILTVSCQTPSAALSGNVQIAFTTLPGISSINSVVGDNSKIQTLWQYIASSNSVSPMFATILLLTEVREEW